MHKFEPTGYFILAKEVKLDNFVTKGKIELVNQTYTTAQIVENTTQTEFKDIYKAGDIVLINENAGNPITYNGEPHLFLNAKPYPEGQIICIIKQQKIGKDKGDSL